MSARKFDLKVLVNLIQCLNELSPLLFMKFSDVNAVLYAGAIAQHEIIEITKIK